MKHNTLVTSAAALILCVAPTHADSTGFTGFYAPETWTITGAGIGGSSATFAPDGSELELISSDGGFGSTINATHLVLADGIWSFHWSWANFTGTPGFEASYYLINGTKFLLSDFCGMESGTADIPVSAGQTVGWQIISVDGIFSPGYLTITDFRITIPTSAALSLLGLAAMPRARCRR